MQSALPGNARMLVIAVARIGDTVLGTPAMRAVKQVFPDGSLTVLAHPKRVDVLANLPFIDRLGTIDKLGAWWKDRLSGPLYDAAVVFGREPSLVAYALRVAQQVAVYDEPALGAHERLIRVPVQEGNHAVLDRLRLLAALGIEARDRRLAYQRTQAEIAAAKALLAARWPSRPARLVGFQMSSFPTKAHRDWPVENFSRLAERLCADHPEVRFVVLGDEHAREACGSFLKKHSESTLFVAGKTSLRESAALIGELDLYVGVDTGPTHIAGALGVPMVGLYHCLYPGRLLAPLDHPACRVIEHPDVGEPGCSDASSMDAIDIDTVHRAASELLGTRTGVAV